MRDLSVLIPARNEEWLARTVADVLEHAKADTEVIVVLDGSWPVEPLPTHPRLQVVHHAQPIGQRAATNLAARISEARYVMKLDAHCSVADGFDVVLIEAAAELGPDVTQIPAQRNLHIYDVVCEGCGWRQYQGVVPAACPKCTSALVRRDIIWQSKRGSLTTSWVFDAQPKFQYDKVGQKAQQGDICDVMSSLGACLFMERQRFWQLGGLDESVGSWGSFGIEIACKSWLSGGRHVVNKRTHFSHFFRVGGIGFPYAITGSQQEAARDRTRQTWFQNAWPGQVRPLSWLVEKFAPVPGWTSEQIAALDRAPLPTPAEPTKGIVYYSDCRGDAAVLGAVRSRLATMELPIVSVTLGAVPGFGRNVVLDAERGYLTMFRQILAGLEALDTDVAFLCEHDVLYDRSHFAFTPPRDDTFYYNQHVWKVDAETGKALHYLASQTSGLCANRQLLIAHYRERVARVEREGFSRSMGFEPGTRKIRHGGIDDRPSATWMSERPNIDVRHGQNLTPSRWKKEQFRNQKYTAGWTEADGVPGWGKTRGRFTTFLLETT